MTKEKWKAFFAVVLDPWVILLSVCTAFLSWFLIRQRDPIYIATATLFVSLFSGVLGGIITKRWDDITEEKLVVTRAKSANRSLQLLLGSVISVERRTRVYLQRYVDTKYSKKISKEVLKTYFEELIEECLSIEEKVINSIEDWTDILPNVEIKTVLNYIRELKTNYQNASVDLEHVNRELQRTKNKSEQEINRLREEKREITDKLSGIEKELSNKSIQVGVPSIGGSLITEATKLPRSMSDLKNPYLGIGDQEMDASEERTAYPAGSPSSLAPGEADSIEKGRKKSGSR